MIRRIALIAFIIWSFFIAGKVYCAEIPEDKAVIAVYGEALHNYQAEYALACALRNRGSLKGVYGVDQKPSEEGYQLASKAWNDSENGIDVTNGATHWLSDYDLEHCKPQFTEFRFKMKETLYQGRTHFYRLDNKR